MTPAERYLVFRADDYYPSGGWHDLVGKAASRAKGVLPSAHSNG